MSEAPVLDQRPAGSRSRRTVWWLIAVGVLLLALIASLPWIWARRIESAVFAELTRRHGQDFAIIAMHVDGEDGERLNLYRKLWYHLTTKPDYSARWNPGRIYGSYHLGVLVSDNRSVYRYYWSLREDRLELEGEARLKALSMDDRQRAYLWIEPEVRLRHGVRWKQHPVGAWINWYPDAFAPYPPDGNGLPGP